MTSKIKKEISCSSYFVVKFVIQAPSFSPFIVDVYDSADGLLTPKLKHTTSALH